MVNYAQATGDVEGLRGAGTQVLEAATQGSSSSSNAYDTGVGSLAVKARLADFETGFIGRKPRDWAVVECRSSPPSRRWIFPAQQSDENVPGWRRPTCEFCLSPLRMAGSLGLLVTSVKALPARGGFGGGDDVLGLPCSRRGFRRQRWLDAVLRFGDRGQGGSGDSGQAISDDPADPVVATIEGSVCGAMRGDETCAEPALCDNGEVMTLTTLIIESGRETRRGHATVRRCRPDGPTRDVTPGWSCGPSVGSRYRSPS